MIRKKYIGKYDLPNLPGLLEVFFVLVTNLCLLLQSTANAIKVLFPEDREMLDLADFIVEADSWFDTMNR